MTTASIATPNVRFLRQGLELLESLDDGAFTAPGGAVGQAGVGAHLRHAIDYYRCFLDGLADGRIDYDARQREPRVEADRRAAAESICEIIAGLERLRDEDADTPLAVRVDAAAWEGAPVSWGRSSLARELQFLLSHTVHHYALIAAVLRGQGLEPSEGFGVAPSTLEHRRTVGAGAPCAR